LAAQSGLKSNSLLFGIILGNWLCQEKGGLSYTILEWYDILILTLLYQEE
jgi:hypothetical protein